VHGTSVIIIPFVCYRNI